MAIVDFPPKVTEANAISNLNVEIASTVQVPARNGQFHIFSSKLENAGRAVNIAVLALCFSRNDFGPASVLALSNHEDPISASMQFHKFASAQAS